MLFFYFYENILYLDLLREMIGGGEQHLVNPRALVTREDDPVGGALLLGQDHLTPR